MMDGKMSRRNFLKGTAGVTFALAGLGALGGCGSNSSQDSASNAATGNTSEDWDAQPSVPASIGEELDVDILVMGSGDAGLNAAYGALSNGAKNVLIIERSASSRVGGGVHGWLKSTYTEAYGWRADQSLVDEMIKEEIRLSHCHADERFFRIWAERSEEVGGIILKNIDTTNVHLSYQAPTYDQIADEYFSEVVYPIGHQVSGSDTNSPVIEGLTSSIKGLGGEIRFNCAGEQLIVGDGGAVVGAYAYDSANGYYVKLNANAVIICTGGFEGNITMIDVLMPWISGVTCANSQAGDGSGIRAGYWAGAAFSEEPMSCMLSAAVSPSEPNIPTPIPFMIVNKNGTRFVNEATSSFVIPCAILQEPDKTAYQVFDRHYAEQMRELGTQTWMGIVTYDEEKQAQFEQNAISADTLEGLAEKLDMDSDVFVAQVDRRNGWVDKGHDDDFGLPVERLALTTVKDAPFYAYKIPYYNDVTLSGILVDPETSQCIDSQKNRIKGLYAAGNTVGRRFSYVYTNNMTGLSNAFADVFGYIAGESAAKA